MISFIKWILNLSVFEALLWLFLIFLIFLVIRNILERIQIDNLTKRAVFITGCDTGFGRGLASKCLEHGMPVFAGCLTQQGIESLRADARKSIGNGRSLDAFLMDVTSDESVGKVAKLLEEKCEKFGGLHAVVNNAGITGKHISDDFLDIKEYLKVAEINLWGPIRTTMSVKKLLKKARGRIVTVASICARVGLPGLGPYTVSKFGVSAYCDVIRQELRPFGISVHILEPGFFDTPLINRQKIDGEILEAWEQAPSEIKKEYGEKFFNDARQSSQLFLNTIASSNISLVIDAYFHAITSKYPRSRYQVGWDSILLFIPFSFLPTGIQDYIFAAAGLFLPKPACQ
uniref:17-beta-hydroxysteroid dehydrogenase type 6 n=1 Tax=Caenorhabditis tropicalis TaxID=1561998 RepID=A0A1I7UY43_9PELO